MVFRSVSDISQHVRCNGMLITLLSSFKTDFVFSSNVVDNAQYKVMRALSRLLVGLQMSETS